MEFGMYKSWTDVLCVALWQQGGKRKEGVQLRLWNLNICIKKLMRNADWQRWH